MRVFSMESTEMSRHCSAECKKYLRASEGDWKFKLRCFKDGGVSGVIARVCGLFYSALPERTGFKINMRMLEFIVIYPLRSS